MGITLRSLGEPDLIFSYLNAISMKMLGSCKEFRGIALRSLGEPDLIFLY